MDNNSTTRTYDHVAQEVAKASTTLYANPSSSHTFGKRACELLKESRSIVAECLRATPEEIIFTSGATESNALMFHNIGTAPVIISAIEHPSVKEHRSDAMIVPVDRKGRVNLAKLESLLRVPTGNRMFVSIMFANNEIGTIQPVREISSLCRKYGAFFHCDATQYAGKYIVYPRELGIDAMSMSSHKFHGPKGVGALWIAREHLAWFRPLALGGKQEANIRAGTENVPGIWGMALAMQHNIRDRDFVKHCRHVRAMRDQILESLRRGIPGLVINGDQEHMLPNTLSVCIPGCDSRQLIERVSEGKYAICVNAGSACSKGKRSAVLEAIGIPAEHEKGALRISLSRFNTEEECNVVADTICRLCRVK